VRAWRSWWFVEQCLCPYGVRQQHVELLHTWLWARCFRSVAGTWRAPAALQLLHSSGCVLLSLWLCETLRSGVESWQLGML
jgi:hypothetical protein